ncbi:discoidin domain-containing protein [Mycolicibacterium neoaurum]|uniref:discoidin domain-containing protein n=1 Tax=Mycolicibacterium neoaurum TaxID=1795 RepID=UPI001F4CDD6D|nr:discoidin domain-containing protein [Mycolicibacterium neoaurum]
MTSPAGRYSSTEHFLAHIDEAEYAPVPADDEAFEPFEADEHLDLDPEPPVQPRAAVPPWADSEPDRGEFGEPSEPAWSTSDRSDQAAPEAEQYDTDDPEMDYAHGDGYSPDAAYRGGDDDDEYGGDYGPIDADGHPTADLTPFGADETSGDEDDEIASHPPRFSKPVVIGFLGAVGVVTIGLAAAMVSMQSSSTEPTPSAAPASSASAVPAPPPHPAAAPINDPSQDVPIPFQASSPCPQAGSGSAQNVASDDPTRAWVCMRDSDGQVMTLDLGKPMKVTAIELTPGWVGTDASGADQWMQHRVVTRVQWILINGADRTVVTQDTKNAHGPVPQAMPSNGPDQGVLASQVQMVILQTSRPPADSPVAGSTAPGADPSNGGILPGILGAPLGGEPSAAPSQDPNFGTPETGSDPVDNTVAISSIKILGHPPL